MNPCDKCAFEWHDLKNGCSCRDECLEYKKWQPSKLDKALKFLESGEPLPSVDELIKRGEIKAVIEIDQP